MAIHVAIHFEAERTWPSPGGRPMSGVPPLSVNADKTLLGKIEDGYLSKRLVVVGGLVDPVPA